MKTGITGTIGESTKGLSDRSFIGEYSEQIIAKYSSEPYFVDLNITYDDWKYHHQKKQFFQIRGLLRQKKEITQENIDNFIPDDYTDEDIKKEYTDGDQNK